MSRISITEALGGIDDEFIAEAADSKRKRKVYMNKKKIIAIALAAALIVAAGVTTLAATSGGLFKMKRHFDNVKDKYSMEDVPVIDNATIYASEVDSTAESNSVSAQVISATCDGYSIYAVVDVTVDGLIMPDDVTEESYFSFREWNNGNHAISCAIVESSREDNTFTYVFNFSGMRNESPNEDITISLRDFGYYATRRMYDENGKNLFITLKSCLLDLKISASNLKIQKGIKADSSAEVQGVELEVELSPLGLLMYGDYSEMQLNADDNSFLGLNAYEFHMRDGSVLGDYFNNEELHGLLNSHNGWVDFEEGIEYTHVGFSVPVDVSKIESVWVHGVPFYFSSTEAE